MAGPGVTFLGRVSEEEKRERLGRAHALVATSVREGWGLVVTEAAASGTVAIGYDVAGLRDSIGASGGILTPADPASLATGLVRLLVVSCRWLRAPGQACRSRPVGGGRRCDPRSGRERPDRQSWDRRIGWPTGTGRAAPTQLIAYPKRLSRHVAISRGRRRTVTTRRRSWSDENR